MFQKERNAAVVLACIVAGVALGGLGNVIAQDGYSRLYCDTLKFYTCETGPAPNCPLQNQTCIPTSIERGVVTNVPGLGTWRFFGTPGRYCSGICVADPSIECYRPSPPNSCQPILP